MKWFIRIHRLQDTVKTAAIYLSPIDAAFQVGPVAHSHDVDWREILKVEILMEGSR